MHYARKWRTIEILYGAKNLFTLEFLSVFFLSAQLMANTKLWQRKWLSPDSIGDLRMVRGDCEPTQGVNPEQERGFGVVLSKLWTLVALITAAVGAICSTTVPVGTRLHWSTDSRPVYMGRLRRDGQCCGQEAQCGRRTKINWIKTAHNTRICTMWLLQSKLVQTVQPHCLVWIYLVM